MTKFLPMRALVNLAICALTTGVFQAPSFADLKPSKRPAEPILRLDTGMHTARINGIGVDQANRYLVTGSLDKSVRVWDLATGRLLRVLRPPLGEGEEGEIYAVALSPDGRMIAAGGSTGYAWDESYSVYLFDRASGRLIRRLQNLPTEVGHLTFSPDGQRLAAVLSGTGGLRVFRLSDGALLFEDRDYGGISKGAHFDAIGRLVTSSFDGWLRLYNQTGQLLAKEKAPGGLEPWSVTFSPDGSRIAVGFYDSRQFNVLSGRDLSWLFSPDTTGVNNGSLISAAWSLDGQRLYAGGTFHKAGNGFIRIWPDGGQGRPTDSAGESTIMDLIALRDGGIAYGTAHPTFGRLDATGRRTLLVTPTIVDHRGDPNDFRLTSDGASVAFMYEIFGKSFPARFSLMDRSITHEVAGQDLAAPVTIAEGLQIEGWEHTTGPTLNGRPLKLRPSEISRALSIAPDRQAFLLGTDWYLRLLDRSGRELRKIPVPDTAWAVNIAGNGRVAVAAFGDGTIRWYRLSDGKELLAFFPHADRKRWVLWTPSGYYDVAPGGEELIGWHINRGKAQAADFFPVGEFRSKYYRPDVVAKVLETLDEGEAIRMANAAARREGPTVSLTQQLPPVVTILSPEDGATISTSDVTVRFTVRQPSGEPVTGLKILVDGRPVSTRRDIAVKAKGTGEGAVQQVTVTIPPQDSEIGLLAENRFATSPPAIIRLRWRGAPAAPFVIKPKLYVLAVGIGQYTRPEWRLDFAAKDAQDFTAAMQRQEGALYEKVVVKLITDAEASKDDVLDGLEWLRKQTTQKDVAMLFFAGHGENDENGKYYFLPANVDPDRLMRTGVPYTEVKDTIETIAGKAVAFIDTCHSGGIMGRRRGPADLTRALNELSSSQSGGVVFAAATGRQFSLEDKAWGNGAFTKALVEGLTGRADLMHTGTITINSLDTYIAERVKQLTSGRQTPTTTKPQTIPDFPIALRQ